jgi:hypothetical protein
MLLLLTTAACGGPLAVFHRGPIEGGPLANPPGREMWGVVAKPGYTFTDGDEVLDVRGHDPITVLSVSSVGGSKAFQFLGAKVVGPRRYFTTTQRIDAWPPTHVRGSRRIGDAVGRTFRPANTTWHGQAYELLLGYRVIADTYDVRTGVRVVYRVDGKTYQVTMPNFLVACSTRQNFNRCEKHAWNTN